MNPNIFYAAFFFPAAAAVIIFFMKYVSEILQARVRLGQDAAYRELAAKAEANQTTMSVALADIQSKLVAIEKILKEVE
jgi:uncharacterized protein YfeS